MEPNGLPARKPLYISGEVPTSVRLDGPSLVVQRKGAAGRRFPLSRLTRVVTSGRQSWSHEALVACLDHGVTLTLLSPDGTARGFSLPACDPATRDSQRFEEFLSRGDWAGLYDNWVRSCERREILYALKLMRLKSVDLRASAVTETIETRLSRAAPLGFCRQVKTILEGLLASRITEYAGNTQIAPGLLAGRRPGFHFLRDWNRVLAWRLYPDTQQFLRRFLSPRMKNRAPLRTELKKFYEQSAKREQRRILRYFDSFRFWLGGLEGFDGRRRRY